jgi:TPR repeat protein
VPSALALLRRLAIAEDPEGQFRLAMLLEQPRSLAQPDPDGAAYWYGPAAEQGHPVAARRVGDLYGDGRVGSFRAMGGLAPLVGEAIRWYQTAIALGDAEAAGALVTLRDGSALADALLLRASGDHATARARLEALAEAGDLEAMYWRGIMAEPARAVSPTRRAPPWYERAYQRGFGDAAFALGRLYETGHGVPRDIDQACRMYAAAGVRSAGPGRRGGARAPQLRAPVRRAALARRRWRARGHGSPDGPARREHPAATGVAGDADAQCA